MVSCQSQTHLNSDSQLVAACDAVVNSLGLDGVDVQQAGAAHVHRVYCGDVPWSLASAWVTDNEDLRTVVVKAYRCEEILVLFVSLWQLLLTQCARETRIRSGKNKGVHVESCCLAAHACDVVLKT